MNLPKIIMTIFGAVALLASAAAQQSPKITFKTVEGKTVGIAQSQGRFVVMYFDGTWNPMVDKTIPALQEISDRFSGREVDFYWVSINSVTPGEKNYLSDQDLGIFAKEMRMNVPVLRDPERTVFRSLGLAVIPTIVLFDRHGNVHCTITGSNLEQPDRLNTLTRTLNELFR